MYEEYAQIVEQESEIKLLKEKFRKAIMVDMVKRGVEKEVHNLGQFTVTKLKKWTYPEIVEKLQDKYKAAKAKAESTGEATYIEEESLRFTSIKI